MKGTQRQCRAARQVSSCCGAKTAAVFLNSILAYGAGACIAALGFRWARLAILALPCLWAEARGDYMLHALHARVRLRFTHGLAQPCTFGMHVNIR